MDDKLKKTWKSVKLGSVVELNKKLIGRGFPYKEIEYVDISSVGTGKLLETKHTKIGKAPGIAKRLVSDGDTILSTVRPNRRSFLFIKNPKSNLVVSTGFTVLSPSEKINSRFLYYLITDQRLTDYLANNAKGAAYPAVDAEIINRAKIQLPLPGT